MKSDPTTTAASLSALEGPCEHHAFVQVINSGHRSVTSTGQACVTRLLASMGKFDKDMIFIGEKTPLSRRKARKLAYRYRGSSRGDRYRDFLNGALVGFYKRGSRLVRIPTSVLDIGNPTFVTLQPRQHPPVGAAVDE